MMRFFLAVFFAVSALPAAAQPYRAISPDDSGQPLAQLKDAADIDELPSVQTPIPTANENQHYWIVVRAASREERTAIATAGLPLDEIGSDWVAGTANNRVIGDLMAMGFKILFQENLAELTKDFPPQDKEYHDYGRMKTALENLAKANPDLVSVFSIGKGWDAKAPHDILVARFNTTQSGTQPSSKPGALFVGNHHAREHLSVEIPLKIAEHLAANRNTAAIKKLLAGLDIYILPMLNPDGAEYDIATGKYKWHRKNMRRNPDGQIGVDLNRNCDFLFGGQGSSGNTYSDTYHGPSAFSEPETRALKTFVDARPNIKTFNSFHSYGELIMYPWGGADSPVNDAQDLKAFKAMAQAMAQMTGFDAMQSNELYIATGDCADWAYDAHKIFAFTTELGGSGFYPGSAEIARQAPGQIKAALYLLEHTANPTQAAAQ